MNTEDWKVTFATLLERFARAQYMLGVVCTADVYEQRHIQQAEKEADSARQALIAHAAQRDHIRDATEMVQPVGEVPMPDVHDYGYHDSDNGWVETLACDAEDVRTYGDAREAAGYARGRAEPGGALESAQQRAEYWKSEHCAANAEIDKLRADLAASQAECERLRADAKRYRWLRGDCCSNSERWTRWEIQRWDGVWNPIQGMEMDAYVDAALSGEVKP